MGDPVTQSKSMVGCDKKKTPDINLWLPHVPHSHAHEHKHKQKQSNKTKTKATATKIPTANKKSILKINWVYDFITVLRRLGHEAQV